MCKVTLCLKKLISFFLLFFFILAKAQKEVIVRPKVPANVNKYTKEQLKIIAEQKYMAAKARHMALQDEKTRLKMIYDLKLTNEYNLKRKDSKFAKWLKFQKFKLKRKGII